ncbi:MAG: dihydrolipoamide acetyltransferase family protein [Gemmataceae bacterium]
MEYHLPTIGEGIYEAELVRWLVQPGQDFKAGTPLLEVLTDKATMEVPASQPGKVVRLRVEPGDKIKIGQAIFDFESSLKSAETPGKVEASTPPTTTKSVMAPRPANGQAVMASSLAVKASPSVRYLARKMGLDLGQIQGSGPQGRILLEDLLPRITPVSPSENRTKAPAPSVDLGKPGTRWKWMGMRRKIADRMVQSKRTIPHYSYIDEVEVTDLVKIRNSLKEEYGRSGIKLTYLPFIIKAVARALQKVPIVNSTLNEEQGEIVLHDHYHVGFATSTPAGLMVPVIQDADKKTVGQIAREMDRLSTEARSGKIKLPDLQGGTFTVSSVGNLGGLLSTPVINYPEVGILGIGKMVRRPVYDAEDRIRPADLLYLSFSFDHRVVDGAVGAIFGNAVIHEMTNPARLLLPEQL